MKLKQIALSCAVALALPMAAHAVAPANGYDTGIPSFNGPASTTGQAMYVILSGATAPDNFLTDIMGSLLKPIFYRFTAPNYQVFVGETLATGTPPNQKIVFVKRSEGGSVFGVNPIGDAQQADRLIKTMIVNATVCPGIVTPVASPGVNVCSSSAIVGNDPGFGPANGAVESTFGIADLKPFMFKTPLNTEYSPLNVGPTAQLTDPEIASMTSITSNTIMLGIVTTKDVADTLKITKADYHAMLTGAITDWNTIGAGIPTNDLKNNVVVCRRVPGSGTQASYNWYFNQFPCTSNSLTSGLGGNTDPQRMTASEGYNTSLIPGSNGSGSSAANRILIDMAVPGYKVIEGSGSSNVRACLKAAAENAVHDFQDEAGLFHRVNFNVTLPAAHTATTGWRAIGTLSLDSQTNTLTTSSSGGAETAWFFRALNGNGRFFAALRSPGANPEQFQGNCRVGATLPATAGAAPTVLGTQATGTCPSRDNLRTGDYDFAGELSFQYRTGALDANRQAFVTSFINRASEPSFQALWTLSLPEGLVAPTGTNAVSFASRQGNQCGPLIRGTF